MNCERRSLLEVDNKQQEQMKQNQTQTQQKLNLIQEPNIQTQEENPSNKLKDIHKEYRKNQAFSNFIKCHVPLFSQVEKGVTVKMINHNIEAQNSDANKLGKVKTVQFNLQNNYLHSIVKHPSEYLTLNEKFNLQRSIQQYAMQNRFDSTSEEEDDDVEDQHSVIEIVVKELTQQPKSILKKQPKEFKHETDDDEDYYQNKGLSFKEIRNLEKKVKEHDYGVGLELLQKLGFKYGEGLGINRQGILEPVIPVKKQVFTGTQSNQNKANEEDQVWLYDQPYETKNTKKADKIWRKRNQTDNQQNSSSSYQLNSKDNIIQEYLDEVKELAQSVQHLLFNKLSKYEITEQIIQQKRDQTIKLEIEKEKILSNLEKQKESIRKKESFQKYLLFFQDDEVQISNEPFPLYEKFLECFIKHPDMFIQFNLIDVLIKQGVEDITENTRNWEGPHTDILENEFKYINKIVYLGKDVFIQQQQMATTSNSKDQKILIIDNVISENDFLNLETIVDILVNPIKQKLINYIHTKYDPCSDNLLLEMLKLWTTDIQSIEIEEFQGQKVEQLKLFNARIIENISNLLVPKLLQTISNWSINDSFQLHKIILPWMSSRFNNQELSDLLIEKLLSIDLDNQPDFGLSVLSPWSKLRDIQWNQILEKQVIPKMISYMSSLDATNFDDIKRILQHFEHIQDYAETLFEPLMEKIKQHVSLRMEENVSCRDPGIHQSILEWLNGWELILQDQVLSKSNLLSAKFKLIKEKLI
ncbi:unnamed protein product (macronuclear) [Paramecium tetraurelia]|uniref:G-patch domain-containing protein n=1 Tax=Paramecium tetraurelia TaxID=5888 RepID=A0BGW7_PARTE|nr:uncharacterized protein GSPATT00028819001 [Paramecium tetraurelia]CAK57784.1 unnamed protein product [Paramecium tetraurelia]|eukprot:XP_001425182.1 hypothetical protein (macronuclear) [Paramecium tetraurelia strain d4-2]